MHLDLGGNKIRENGVIGLEMGISKLLSLEKLYLNLEDNEIQEKGAIELGLWISKLLSL